MLTVTCLAAFVVASDISK